MTKYFLFLLTFINCFHSNSQGLVNRKDSLNRKQGHWIIYKDPISDSIKLEEGDYVNDRKEGFWVKYHEDGITPRLKGEYRNNRPAGVYFKGGNTGNVTEIGHFEKNMYHDSLKRFYPNGQLEYEAWYNANGKEEGRVNYYYEDGKTELTFMAKDGVPYESEHYDRSGKLISSQNGPIICYTPYKEPVCIKENDSLPPPKLPETTTTRYIHLKGECYRFYNEDDEIWQDGTFKNGQLWNGKVYVYDKDGILLRVKIFKEGVYCCDGQL